MIDIATLDKVYKERLDEKIIAYLAEVKHLSNREAMDIYYRSRLSQEIHDGCCGIENLDHKYLVNDLIENEPELFDHHS
ncbi:MAG: hypothetical protein IJU23_09310 [Proteobacteria bacterium]|nr:hypothetical protein [Pseudomonadota bacterium]